MKNWGHIVREDPITRMCEAQVKPIKDHEKFGSYYYIDLERVS